MLLGGKEIWWYQDDLDSNSACRPDLRPDLKGGNEYRYFAYSLHIFTQIEHNSPLLPTPPQIRGEEGRDDGGGFVHETLAQGAMSILTKLRWNYR